MYLTANFKFSNTNLQSHAALDVTKGECCALPDASAKTQQRFASAAVSPLHYYASPGEEFPE